MQFPSALGLPSRSTSFEVRNCDLIWVGDAPCTVGIVGSSRRVCLEKDFDFGFALARGFSVGCLASSFSWSGAGDWRASLALDRVRGRDFGGSAATSRGARGAIVRRLLAVRTGRPVIQSVLSRFLCGRCEAGKWCEVEGSQLTFGIGGTRALAQD